MTKSFTYEVHVRIDEPMAPNRLIRYEITCTSPRVAMNYAMRSYCILHPHFATRIYACSAVKMAPVSRKESTGGVPSA